MFLLLTTVALATGPDLLADEAVAANPSLEAMEARTRQLAALAEVADLWPDPMLGVEYSSMAVDEPLPGSHPMSGVQFKAQQTLPTPGLTDLRAEVAEGRVDISEEATLEAELRLRRQVEQTWWRLALSRTLKAVTEEHIDRTEELLAAVRSRYETGNAGQSALLRLGLLADRLADDLGDYERADLQLSAALAGALARDEGTFDTPEDIAPVPVEGDVDAWLATALELRPELRRLELVAENEERAADLARIDARPDLTVWGGYRVRTQEADGTDLISLGLSAPIPLNSSRRGEAIAAGHLEAASGARHQHDAFVDQLQASLTTAWARWARSADKADTYDTVLIPAAVAALETTLSDYRVGKVDFTSLYEAEVDLLMLERARLAASTDTHVQRAEVRALTGESL